MCFGYVKSQADGQRGDIYKSEKIQFFANFSFFTMDEEGVTHVFPLVAGPCDFKGELCQWFLTLFGQSRTEFQNFFFSSSPLQVHLGHFVSFGVTQGQCWIRIRDERLWTSFILHFPMTTNNLIANSSILGSTLFDCSLIFFPFFSLQSFSFFCAKNQ